MLHPICVFAALLVVSAAGASELQTVGPDSPVVFLGAAEYTLRTRGNDQVNTGRSGFERSSSAAGAASSLSVSYSDYLELLPPHSLLEGATLDLSGMFDNLSVISSLDSGTFFYQPVFSAALTNVTVQIASARAEVSMSWNSCAAYDLWPVFEPDLLADEPIVVSWTADEILAADISTYPNTVKNGKETFLVQSAIGFANNRLALDYATETPEPFTTVLIAAGLATFARRRTISRR
jgi:hypothetical protein